MRLSGLKIAALAGFLSLSFGACASKPTQPQESVKETTPVQQPPYELNGFVHYTALTEGKYPIEYHLSAHGVVEAENKDPNAPPHLKHIQYLLLDDRINYGDGTWYPTNLADDRPQDDARLKLTLEVIDKIIAHIKAQEERIPGYFSDGKNDDTNDSIYVRNAKVLADKIEELRKINPLEVPTRPEFKEAKRYDDEQLRSGFVEGAGGTIEYVYVPRIIPGPDMVTLKPARSGDPIAPIRFILKRGIIIALPFDIQKDPGFKSKEFIMSKEWGRRNNPETKQVSSVIRKKPENYVLINGTDARFPDYFASRETADSMNTAFEGGCGILHMVKTFRFNYPILGIAREYDETHDCPPPDQNRALTGDWDKPSSLIPTN